MILIQIHFIYNLCAYILNNRWGDIISGPTIFAHLIESSANHSCKKFVLLILNHLIWFRNWNLWHAFRFVDKVDCLMFLVVSTLGDAIDTPNTFCYPYTCLSSTDKHPCHFQGKPQPNGAAIMTSMLCDQSSILAQVSANDKLASPPQNYKIGAGLGSTRLKVNKSLRETLKSLNFVQIIVLYCVRSVRIAMWSASGVPSQFTLNTWMIEQLYAAVVKTACIYQLCTRIA